MNFYEFSYNYLLKQTDGILSKSEIDSFITEVDSSPNRTIESIYEMMVVVLQDYQSMPNVIKYFERKEEIKTILKGFNVREVAKLEFDSIYNSFKTNFGVQVRNEKKNSWYKFSRGVYEGAIFLSKFNSLDDFDAFINAFRLNSHTKLALPLLLSTEIYGLGFALACNWLKELGYKEYPKPDVHMIDIFKSINYCGTDQISCYKAMVKTAEECSVDAYALDKVLWLICSGNYYRYNKTSEKSSSQLKKEFIEALKEWKAEQ